MDQNTRLERSTAELSEMLKKIAPFSPTPPSKKEKPQRNWIVEDERQFAMPAHSAIFSE